MEVVGCEDGQADAHQLQVLIVMLISFTAMIDGDFAPSCDDSQGVH